MPPLSVTDSAILDTTDTQPEGSIMDSFTRQALQAVYLADEGLLSLCDMLSAVSQSDWPRDAEDLEWLLWAFGAQKITSER